MGYLMGSGLLAVIVGIIILIADYVFIEFSAKVDKFILDLDTLLKPAKLLIGSLLVVLAVWFGYIAVKYQELWYFHILWPLALIFGALYLFHPDWLEALSKVANSVVFPTKERLRGFFKIIGILFLLAGIYILVMAYIFTFNNI
ncbi:MAG: hypothetical protein PHH14_01710 [Candidatus Margulisbacteria bacterium]|nr:hypothetical protein [Candidatus Margulisiibacteriota bacterium]